MSCRSKPKPSERSITSRWVLLFSTTFFYLSLLIFSLPCLADNIYLKNGEVLRDVRIFGEGNSYYGVRFSGEDEKKVIVYKNTIERIETDAEIEMKKKAEEDAKKQAAAKARLEAERKAAEKARKEAEERRAAKQAELQRKLEEEQAELQRKLEEERVAEQRKEDHLEELRKRKIALPDEMEVRLVFKPANIMADIGLSKFTSIAYEGTIINTSFNPAPFVYLHIEVSYAGTIRGTTDERFRNLRPGESRQLQGLVDLREPGFLSLFDGHNCLHEISIEYDETRAPR